MGAREGENKVKAKATSSYLVLWSRENALTEMMENWRRNKLGWERRERKDHEFNFGLKSEVIIEERYRVAIWAKC